MPRTEQPLGPGDDALTSFARDLRALRAAAGGPTYRELARRSHYSATTLADAAGGKRLPSLAATTAFVRACAGDTAEWEARWHFVAGELARPPGEPQPAPEGKAPYIGLAPFQAEDADRFFGRAELVEQLIGRLRERRFLAVFGASGAGKSSLLRAGLIATVRQGQDPPPVLLMTPGRQPVEECAVQLAALTGEQAAALRAELAEGPEHLHLRVRQALAERPGQDLLLVVDQFEEVFTLCAEAAERERFLAMLLAAATAPTSRIRVVLGVRTDFYTHCAAHAELVAAIQDGQVLLGPMTTEQLREAITRPALDRGYRLENSLVATVMAETAGEPGVLPLVSHALLETWRRRKGTTLTSAGYQAAGGIAHAIARTAEGGYAEFDQAQQTVARHLFLRLTALGEGTEDTKRRVYHRELDDHPDTAHVVDQLVRARLVTADRDGLEISHEALIRCWPRLRDWLDADREGLRTHRLLTEATDTWESLDRDPAALYRGVRLAGASAWAAGNAASMTVREREFLHAAEQARQEEIAGDRRRTRRLRQLVAAVVVFALLASATAIVAFRAQNTAERHRDEATFRQVLAEADRLAESDPSLSAQFALAAHRMRPADQTVHTRLLGTRAAPLAEALTGHRNEVYQTEFSADRKLLATTGDDGTVRLWDVRDPTGAKALGEALRPGVGWLSAVVFSADSTLLVTAGERGRVLLWDISDPAHPRPLPEIGGPSEKINILAFQPGTRRLAVLHADYLLRLVDLADPRQPKPLAQRVIGRTGEAWALAYSRDGRTLATGGDDGLVQLWAVQGNGFQPLCTLTGGDSVYGVAFTPDGGTVVAGGKDATVRLWRTADGSQLDRELTGHVGPVWKLAFNQDGQVLATVGADGQALLWNVVNPAAVTRLGPPLAGSSSALYAVGFSPDGQTLATGSGDGVVRLWSLPPALLGHQERIDSVTVSADGRLTITGGKDQRIILWKAVDGEPVRQYAQLPLVDELRQCTECATQTRLSADGRLLAVLSNTSLVRLFDVTDPEKPLLHGSFTVDTRFTTPLALSPDGRFLAVNQEEKSSRLWDISDPRAPRKLGELTGHGAEVTSLAYHPGGGLLASAGYDETVRLWDVTDPANPLLRKKIRAPGQVDRVAFSPDGHTLAVPHRAETITLWDVRDPDNPVPRGVLAGHTKPVTGLVFAADSGTLATTSSDRSIRLWRVADPSLPEPIGGPVATAHNIGAALHFRPDGRSLIVGDGTNLARVLTLDVGQAVARICAATGAPTREQWERHLPGVPRLATC